MRNIDNDKRQGRFLTRSDIFGDELHDDAANRCEDKTTRAIARDANRQRAPKRLFKMFLNYF